MKIDVIIPVYKPDDKLFRSINKLARQTIMPEHIFLLNTVEQDNNTTDYLAEKISKIHIRKTGNSDDCDKINIVIKSIKKKEFDHGGTRNFGARLSEADFILFMTQDAVPDNEFLIENLVKTLQEDCIALVYARQKAYGNASYKERMTREFNYPDISCIKSRDDLETFGIKTFFASNVCAMYRRDVFFKLGSFVDNTIFNEDMIFAYNAIKAGYRIGYVAEAVVLHSHKYSIIEQFRRSFDNGVSHNQYKEVFNSVNTESEGFRLLTHLVDRARKDGKQYMIIEYMADCGVRYLGFILGKHFNLIPMSLTKKLSMNKKYWDNY